VATAAGSDELTPNGGRVKEYFPPEFSCHAAVFSRDDSRLYFIGQWWQ